MAASCRLRWLALLLAGALLQGCFWRKKPQAAPAPRPVTRPVARKPAPKKRAAPAARTPQPQPPRPQPEPPPAPPQPDPVSAGALGEILSPEQSRQLDAQVAQDLESARRNLAAVGTRSLTRDQREAVRLARSFISQAERARERDLTLAAQLARRADLLARSVAGTP